MSAVVITMALMVLGVALVAVEVLVIPGFGVIGALGIASVLGAAYVAMTEIGSSYGLLALMGGLAAAAVLLWYVPRTRLGKAMVLQAETRGGAADPELRKLVGREGVTLTPLRPAGAVSIGDEPVDVVSDGRYIEPGTRVRVVQVAGSRVVVEPVS